MVKSELISNLNEYIDYIPDSFSIKNTIKIKMLPYLAGAGSWGDIDIMDYDDQKSVVVDIDLIKHLKASNLRAIRVIGDSMEPEYYEDDIAIIDMVNCRYNFVKIAGIYVVCCDNIVYIKRVEFLQDGGLKLKSLNPVYDDIIVNAEDNYEILGKVCGKIHYEFKAGLTFDNQGVK